MKTVRQLIDEKGGQVYTVGPEDWVFTALEKMAEKDCGALVVVQNGGRVAGIISERDYARKVILKGVSSKEIRVRDIMSTRVVFVQPDQTAEECLALMTDKRVRHLPVLNDNKLAGMVSIGDAVKAIIAEKEFMIGQLENYIMGG